MKRLVFLGSILGTLAAFLAACFFVLATLAWLIRSWHPTPWVVGAAGAGMIAVAVALLWRWWRLPVERRFRFSLRGMLVGITLFALWFGVVGTDVLRWGREAAAIAELLKHSVTVEYYYQGPPGRLIRMFGYNPFLKVQDVYVRRDQGLCALLEHANDLRDLEYLSFWGGAITDAGLVGVEELDRFPRLRSGLISGCWITDASLERLTGWNQLEELHLHNCSRITDDALAHLKQLPNLQFLRLLTENGGTMPVTDAGLAHVVGLRELRTLFIVRVPITDAGLAHVEGLPQLKHLALCGVPVTDEGVLQLRGLKKVEHIHLRNTQVTREGVDGLCEVLPDCHVTWGDKIRFPAVCQICRIEVWDEVPRERLLDTISDVDRIATIKTWLDENHARLQGILSRNRVHWKSEADGNTGACLSLRFEGRNRRLCTIRLGNGIYETTSGNYCALEAAAEEQIRVLLGVDAPEWRTE